MFGVGGTIFVALRLELVGAGFPFALPAPEAPTSTRNRGGEDLDGAHRDPLGDLLLGFACPDGFLVGDLHRAT